MTSFMDSLRRGLDRASFEADKLMRYNRVRGEAGRIQGQAQTQVQTLGERALALYNAGTLQNNELGDLAREIVDLQAWAREKEAEAATIQGEVWVEPPDTPPASAGPAAGSAASAPVPSAPPPAPAWSPPPPAPVPGPAPAVPAWSSGPARPLPTIEDQGTHRIAAPERSPYCPVCGAPLRPQAAFCAQCGVRL